MGQMLVRLEFMSSGTGSALPVISATAAHLTQRVSFLSLSLWFQSSHPLVCACGVLSLSSSLSFIAHVDCHVFLGPEF